MAQFDFKNADMYIRDGYGGAGTINKPGGLTGAVNNVGGYSIGAVTMLITITGAVANGDVFSIVGDPTIYTITAHTETLGNTSSITFTPGLVVSAANNAVITTSTPYAIGASTIAVDGFTSELAVGDIFTIGNDPTEYTVTAETATLGVTTSITFAPPLVAPVGDNMTVTALPHQLEIKLGDGNLTFTEKKARQYIKDRGRLSTVRNADEEPVEVKIDAQWIFLRASTGLPPSLEDALKQRGEASNWVSAASDPCEPYAVDIVIIYAPPCGNVEREVITLADFRYEEIPHDTKAGTLAISGKCNITEPSVARVAA